MRIQVTTEEVERELVLKRPSLFAPYRHHDNLKRGGRVNQVGSPPVHLLAVSMCECSYTRHLPTLLKTTAPRSRDGRMSALISETTGFSHRWY